MSGEKWDTSHLTTGERSVLRRCAGEMMGQDMRAIEAFYKAVGYRRNWNEKACFAALCMECLWRDEEEIRIRPMEEILRDMYQSKDATESLKTHLVSYLDAPWSEDGFLLSKLCRIVRMLYSANHQVRPDFQKLADDLTHWNDADRHVQRRWIRTICRAIETENKKTEDE